MDLNVLWVIMMKSIDHENEVNPINNDLVGLGAPIEYIFPAIRETFVANMQIWGFTKEDELLFKVFLETHTKSELVLIVLKQLNEIKEMKKSLIQSEN